VAKLVMVVLFDHYRHFSLLVIYFDDN